MKLTSLRDSLRDCENILRYTKEYEFYLKSDFNITDVSSQQISINKRNLQICFAGRAFTRFFERPSHWEKKSSAIDRVQDFLLDIESALIVRLSIDPFTAGSLVEPTSFSIGKLIDFLEPQCRSESDLPDSQSLDNKTQTHQEKPVDLQFQYSEKMENLRLFSIEYSKGKTIPFVNKTHSWNELLSTNTAALNAFYLAMVDTLPRLDEDQRKEVDRFLSIFSMFLDKHAENQTEK